MSKEFDFLMPVIKSCSNYLFRSQAQQQQQQIWYKFHSYETGETEFFGKLKNLFSYQIFD